MTIPKIAGCIIPDHNGGFLLLHRLSKGRDYWEVPGGKVEAGESPELAATRELLEELRVNVMIIRRLGDTEFTDRNQSFHYTWFLATTIDRPEVGEPEVFSEWAYLTLADLKEVDKSTGLQSFLDQLQDGKITL